MEEKYLIMKLDEETLTHFPERISDLPLPMCTDIPEGEMQKYQQIILKGDGFDLKTLQSILFPGETDHKIFWRNRDIQVVREQAALRDKFEFLKEFDHDPGREVSSNESSTQGT